MVRWIPYTFVRTVFFFISGIFVSINWPEIVDGVTGLFLLALLTICYFVWVRVTRGHHRQWNPGWLGLITVLFAGYLHAALQRDTIHPLHISKYPGIKNYTVTITGYPEETQQSWRIEARVASAELEGWRPVKGKVLLYFSRKDFEKPFRYGDVLLIKGSPRGIGGPMNPGAFDYRRYLSFKNIYHQDHLQKGEVIWLKNNEPSKIVSAAYAAREWAQREINQHIDGKSESAIASALVLGITDGLDAGMLEAYSRTGSMHILAVSGLHISVLYFIILWLGRPLNKSPGGRWLIALISLTALWFYAFITGLSPSVLRAVMMFSFMAIAKPWSRNTNIYNTLAVSAFVLLLIDPFLIMSAGFQLSYTAVLGIVYIYPRVLSLWEPLHRVTAELWKISAMAIAAQIATLPLTLYYFHQFPNYFLFTNLIVVPLSTVVLIGGLIMLAVSTVAPFAGLLGFCLEWILRAMNAVISFIGSLPLGTIDEVHISAIQCWLLIAFVIVTLIFLNCKRYHVAVLASCLLCIFGMLQWHHFLVKENLNTVVVYHVPGRSAIDLISKGRAIFLADQSLFSDPRAVEYNIIPNRTASGVRVIHNGFALLKQFQDYRLIVWEGKRIVQITGPGAVLPDKLAVDWVIIGNNALKGSPEQLMPLDCKKIILDSSNSFFFASRFLEEARMHNLDVHSVLHDGAWVAIVKKTDT